MNGVRASLGALWIAALLAGCATDGQKVPTEESNVFEISDVAKTDINMIVETQQREVMRYLRLLMTRLYMLNPGEWRKSGIASRDEAIDGVFGKQHQWSFQELDEKRGVDAVALALDPDWSGDRVLAFGAGIGSMLHASYDNQYAFFILDNLEAWKLHNSARNLEIAARQIARARDRDGQPLLRVDRPGERGRGPGTERLFGKMIALQDTMAKVAAQRTKRSVKQAIQFLMFFPI